MKENYTIYNNFSSAVQLLDISLSDRDYNQSNDLDNIFTIR